MHPIATFSSLAVVALCGGVLTACSTVERPMEKAAEAVTGYRAEVLQGNVITKEQVQALKPGMLPVQVRDILGTPLVQSVFHENRWDYAYTIRRAGKTAEQRHLSVFFKDGRLDRTEGDVMPSDAEFATAQTLAMKKESGKKAALPQLVASPEQLKKSEAARTSKGTSSELVKAAPKTYPPLDAPANWKDPTKP